MPVRPKQPSGSHYVFRLPRSFPRILAIAVGIGVLLFVLAWWLGRDDGFYKVEPVAKSEDPAGIDALPVPLPGGDAGNSGLEQAHPAPTTAGTESETAPVDELPLPIDAPAMPDGNPAPDAPIPVPATDVAASTPPPTVAGTSAPSVPTPIAGQSPSPAYPVSAMRSGETGTVLVRVTVAPDGTPSRVDIAQRSGTRSLDHAALEAVRHWRFTPAQQNGQPVTASVDIPISFDLQH